jgi:16S rRNA (uracil1498-N3)-methyltransferase
VKRFFVEGCRRPGDAVLLDGGDAHKIVNVLRMNDGDAIQIVDSAAASFHATVHIQGAGVVAELGERIGTPVSSARRITLAQGIPKGQKMDFVVEKVTELGVAGLIPLQSERTIVAGASSGKLQRWRRLAKSAAAQCGRSALPEIEEPATFDRLLTRFDSYDRVLLPWELAAPVPMRESLPPLLERAQNVLLVIGPEGGFSHDEVQAAQQAGACVISLGQRILRTETAGMVLLAIAGYIWGDA